MYRYIALLWNQHAERPALEAARLMTRLKHGDAEWICRYESTGMAVFDIPPDNAELRAYVLPLGCGVVLGRLFDTDSQVPDNSVIRITERTAEQFAASGGRQLMKEYWGSYVAFLRDAATACQYVIRDCSGKIPCFRTASCGIDVVFSNLLDVVALGLGRFTLNVRYLAAFAYYNELQIRETGLTEITEILAGERFEPSQDGGQQSVLWDPRRICRLEPIEDHDLALSALREAAHQCVASWATVYDEILHSLSGGFDSTVVLSCLIRAAVRPRITCVNRYYERGGEDERPYARLAAAAARVELIEHPWDNGRAFDRHLLDVWHAPKPAVLWLFLMLDLPFRNELARARNARALWTGQGGDHLFFQMRTAFAAADYVQRHGLAGHLTPVLWDAARHSKESYWHVLRVALALRPRGKRWTPESLLQRKSPFVEPSALPADILEYLAGPSTIDSPDLPPGKQLQIRYLAELLNRHRPLPSGAVAEEHHPLLAQPLIEVCLRIPTYVLLQGGRDRALARAAFAAQIPHEIASREAKGQTSSYAASVIRRSLVFVREMLLDGVLVRQGILNRTALEAQLAAASLHGQQLFPVLACLAAEAWARGCLDLRG